ncbi:MAG TPA: class I SAM-dependent methyltransferase [Candidatus Saccharimonadales bacterium]|nr:class I SAM-dependent methyltransferase [Candidatus Saccharimonadales bacterium]
MSVSMKRRSVKKNVSPLRKADQYDDPSYNYLHYWEGRQYEHMAEVAAIESLLKAKHFKHAVDIGGGYGRLCVVLTRFAQKVTLAEPSQQQLDMAKEYLKGRPEIDCKQMQAAHLDFADNSIDLVTMVRVIHHLPDPSSELAEISRVLTTKGYAIIEVANLAHARNRVKYALHGKKIPSKPVDIRSAANQSNDLPFVNHNPQTIIKQLAHAGLTVERTLSVSNLRSPALKRLIPARGMLTVERIMQPLLASIYFGPSIFFLVRKA